MEHLLIQSDSLAAFVISRFDSAALPRRNNYKSSQRCDCDSGVAEDSHRFILRKPEKERMNTTETGPRSC